MSFALDLNKLAQTYKGRLELIARKIVMDVGTRLVMRSPVGDATLWQSPPPPGYVGGRFRANWQYGYGVQPAGELPDVDPSGAASVARITSGATRAPAIGVHYLTNNLPYAMRLENGWSSQAPQGMVELTRIEFAGITSAAARGVRK